MKDAPPGADAEALPLSAELSRELLDAAPDAIVVVDEQGTILLVNVQTERLFGYAREELLGQPVEMLIPQRLRSAHRGHRQHFSRVPRTRPMGSGLELFGLKRDGSEFFIEISLSPLHTAERTFSSASIRDISDRKQTELRARSLQEHLLSAVESIQGAFAIFDVQDRMVLCNSTCRQMLGRKVEGEIVGKRFDEILCANMLAGSLDLANASPDALLQDYLRYHRAPEGALVLRTSDGHGLRLVERRTLEGGTVTTIVDVTDEVEHEEALLRAQTIAEAASSAKSEFLSTMSHELRTPLNAILGFAQLLQRDKKLPLPERHQERIEHVIRGGEHLLRLIDEVLDLSSVEAGQVTVSLEPVELANLLADLKNTLDPMANRAEIELTIAPLPVAAGQVIADRTRLKQVLMNYGSNAIKYGRQRGNVTFRVAKGDALRISVEDDGIGIPSDKQDRIFQPFHRAGQETGSIQGTGIGLAISKRLAELMGGQVGFRSSIGIGSNFWIELAEPRQASIPVPPLSAAAMRGSTRLEDSSSRYLVVYIEDNPSNIAFMKDLLSDFESIELLTASTAEIGLELVRTRKPNVVIMDINLPGMSGFEATRRLRAWPETRDIPIIALSAAAMVKDSSRTTDTGFFRYLTKPIKVDELTSVLEDLLVQ